MRNPQFYAAVYGIIRNDSWDILALKRQNTGWNDGKYTLPAWHLEWNEKMYEWLIWELREEIWIHVWEKDISLVHVSHRIAPDRVYFDYYFEIQNFTWTPINGEPHLCEKIEFIPENDSNFVEYYKIVFEKVRQNIPFSEIII